MYLFMTQQAPNSNTCVHTEAVSFIIIIYHQFVITTRAPGYHNLQQPVHTTPESFTKKSTSDRPHHRPGADFQ